MRESDNVGNKWRKFERQIRDPPLGCVLTERAFVVILNCCMSPGGVYFTPGAVTHSVSHTAVRRLGQSKCYLTGWNGGAVDLVSPSSKISQRLYCSLKVHKEGGEERLAAVQRLQGLMGRKER